MKPPLPVGYWFMRAASRATVKQIMTPVSSISIDVDQAGDRVWSGSLALVRAEASKIMLSPGLMFPFRQAPPWRCTLAIMPWET
jgi:hypothetical protein